MELDNVRAPTIMEKTLSYNADPGSLACVSVGSEDWIAYPVGQNGTFEVDVSRLTNAAVSTVQVVRDVDGSWRGQVLIPPPDALPVEPRWWSRISIWLGVGLATPLLLASLAWLTRCRRQKPAEALGR